MKGSEFLERQLIKALFKAKIEKALIQGIEEMEKEMGLAFKLEQIKRGKFPNTKGFGKEISRRQKVK